MELGTLSVLKPLIAVGALAVGGMGAYNFATTGCPLGSCDATKGTAAVTPASTPVESSCCSSKKDAETTLVADTKDACEGMTCESSTDAVAETVSFDKAAACEAMKAACEAAGECPEAMKAACDAAGMDCHMDQAAEARLVADTAEGECHGKTECEGKTECQDASDEVAQLETETSEG